MKYFSRHFEKNFQFGIPLKMHKGLEPISESNIKCEGFIIIIIGFDFVDKSFAKIIDLV